VLRPAFLLRKKKSATRTPRRTARRVEVQRAGGRGFPSPRPGGNGGTEHRPGWAARRRGRRREQKTALCARWRQERGATAPQAPQRRPRRITTPSVQGGRRPVSGKHERVPSLSGKLHAPGAARIGRAVQVSAANTDLLWRKARSDPSAMLCCYFNCWMSGRDT
jgi:hypothetical protein